MNSNSRYSLDLTAQSEDETFVTSKVCPFCYTLYLETGILLFFVNRRIFILFSLPPLSLLLYTVSRPAKHTAKRKTQEIFSVLPPSHIVLPFFSLQVIECPISIQLLLKNSVLRLPTPLLFVFKSVYVGNCPFSRELLTGQWIFQINDGTLFRAKTNCLQKILLPLNTSPLRLVPVRSAEWKSIITATIKTILNRTILSRV